MLITHLIFVLLMAILFGGAVAAFFRRRSGLAGLSLMFFALALMIWAGGVWVVPFGPRIFGAYPFPSLLTGLVVMLFAAFLAGSPSREHAASAPTPERPRTVVGPSAVVFWILIGFLALLITVRYLSI